MLHYCKYQNKVRDSKMFGKWYGRAVIHETVGIEQIAETMQAACTVKRADVLAVLSELGPVITQLVGDSRRVRIPYLGCFKLSISTTGEENPEDFSIKNNLKNVRVIFQPEIETQSDGRRVKAMTKNVRLRELPEYDDGVNPGGGGENQEP